MKGFFVWFTILILSLGLFACKNTGLVEEPQVVEEEVVEEEIQAEPIEEDALTALRDEIQDEMFVFDVVAHHDQLYDLVSAEARPNMDDETLNALVSKIVEGYMDEQLRIRVDEGLSAIQPEYREEDAQWILNTISTASLYKFITVYEREYYKDQIQ